MRTMKKAIIDLAITKQSELSKMKWWKFRKRRKLQNEINCCFINVLNN